MPSMPLKIGSQMKQRAIKGCKKSSAGQIIVPDDVIFICDEAFRDCKQITSIVIPASVKEISPTAFTGCDALESIEVSPDNPIYFSRDGILYGSNHINEWGNTVEQYLLFCPQMMHEAIIDAGTKFIHYHPFAECRSLVSVTLPAVESVPDDLFDGCVSLQTADISAAAGSVRIERLFSRSPRLEHIILGDSQHAAERDGLILSADGQRLHLCLASCEDVIIPASVVSISDIALQQFGQHKSVTVDPDSETFTMADGILYSKDMTAMIWCPPDRTIIRVPDNVAQLPIEHIKRMPNLTAVEISDCNAAFSSLNGAVFDKEQTKFHLVPAILSKMTLPPMFYTQAFKYCRHIGSIEVQADTPHHIVIGGVLYYHYDEEDTLDLIVCSSEVTSLILPANVTIMSDGSRLPGAFAAAESLSEITVEFGSHSFFARDNVLYTRGDYQRLVFCPRNKTEVNIPRFIRVLDNEAFIYNTMRSITIPKGIHVIGHKCFAHCHALEEVILPQTLKFIGNQAFADCPNLKAVTFPNNAIEYCEDSFDDGVVFSGKHKDCIIHPANEWQDIKTEKKEGS
ncbi:MAG: leucine-rich repeat protein [Spirochaetales bacterium]|nr:leucine-rich repeat protein [Spirochaetales bacterium]